jgi:uncharacterized delta-60 repeat protein
LRLDTLGRGVVCGTVTFGEPVNVWAGLARLTTQGSFDSTFYGYGRYDAPLYADKSTDPPTIAVDNVPSSLVLDSAERIVVTGTFFEPFAPDVAVMRTDTDGKYDPGFGSQGIGRVRLQLPNAVAGDVVPLPEGKLMVSGDYYTTAQIPFLFRLNEDGSPDSTFGSAGLASGAPIDAGHAAQFTFLARTKNGGWLLAGAYLVNDNLLYPPAGVIVVRFRADGSIDTAFADNGVATITPDTGSRPFAANRAALQPDGRLVVAGWMPSTNAPNDPTRNFAVVRILADYDTLFVDGFDPAP